MLIPVIEKTMLYCPKCEARFETGRQTFCPADNTRLIPSSAAKNSGQKPGVFSSLLGSKLGFESQPETPRRDAAPRKPLTHNSLVGKEQTEKPKKRPRFIKPSEIPSGTAEIGDRNINPVGRLAVTAENPNVLLGHLVKNRYLVIGRIRQDANSILFLTKDRLSQDKKTFVRVLLKDDDDELASDILAEERVALSHIDHPNILRVIDSGELPEGKPFIVSIFVEGKTLGDEILKREQFNSERTARIIRQAAAGLSEAHESGILHRRLSPEDIILTVSEEGAEQAKLTNFGVFGETLEEDILVYAAPERIEGNSPTIAGDIYSLAVIAYQMLTGRLPHTSNARRKFSGAREENLFLPPSNARLDVSPAVDAVLKKALAQDASQRFPKARDFGDAFFNAINGIQTTEFKPALSDEKLDPAAAPEKIEFDVKPQAADDPEDFFAGDYSNIEIEIIDDEAEPEADASEDRGDFAPVLRSDQSLFEDSERIVISPDEDYELEAEIAEDEEKGIHESAHIAGEETPEQDLPWQRRSIEGVPENSWMTAFFSLLGIILLFAAAGGIFYYFWTLPPDPGLTVNNAETQNSAQLNAPIAPPNTADIEVPPLPRQIVAPPNSVYFQNSKENLGKELLRNYRGFELYYPKSWKRNNSDNKFIDISRDAANGLPIEQFMVSPYESNGTFQKDKEKFPALVERSNADLKEILPNYRVISQGETNINEGWRAYEVKFMGEGRAENGKPLTLWGRRLWVPAGRPGIKDGLVITMFATSLSDSVKSANDVGFTGGLGMILSTFEPDQNM